MNIEQWNKIKTECPKAFEMFYNTFVKKEIQVFDEVLGENKNLQGLKNICFCDIVDFFHKGDIIISVGHLYSNKNNKYFWHYKISYKSKNKQKVYFVNNEPCKNILLENEAQTEATYKAFQILKERLK